MFFIAVNFFRIFVTMVCLVIASCSLTQGQTIRRPPGGSGGGNGGTGGGSGSGHRNEQPVYDAKEKGGASAREKPDGEKPDREKPDRSIERDKARGEKRDRERPPEKEKL